MLINMLPSVKLGAVAKVISGYAFKSTAFKEGGTIPVIKIKNIKVGTASLNDAGYVSDEFVDKIDKKFHVNPNDILISLTGSHMTQPNSVVGRVGRYPSGFPRALLNQRAGKVIPNTEVIDTTYLFYVLLQDVLRREIAQMASGAASQANISPSQVESINIPLPSLDEQKNLGDILVAYDNLIENNNRRIAILEEMAQSIYREWFIKFRFPGHQNCKFKESSLGLIPEGWKIKVVEELYNTSSGGTPSRKKPEYYGEDHWWVKTRELKDSFVVGVDEKISDLGLVKSSAKLFPKDTVLLAMYGATIGRLGILTHEAASNQACCALIPKENIYSPWFIYLTLLDRNADLLALRQGVAQQNISQQVIKAFKILKPTKELLHLFNSTIEPMFRKIELLMKRNSNLKRQRDILLPRLISGNIQIS